MEEKVIAKNQDQKIVKKKVYTPPILTVYGKLTELTAAGTGAITEAAAKMMNDPSFRL